MKVRREKPSQRRFLRVTAPLFATWRGEELRATNWSLGDLRLDHVDTDGVALHDAVELRLRLPFQGFDIAFEIEARVARIEPDGGGVAFEFVEIGERARDVLSHFIDDLVRGDMVEVAETIARIDVPVTPISTKPDPNPLDQTPVRRWPWKTMLMTLLYAVAGGGLLLYVGAVLWVNYWRFEVRAAVATAPMEVAYALGYGHVGALMVTPGEAVRQGQLIGLFEDRLLERRIAEAEAALASTEELVDAQRRRISALQTELRRVANRAPNPMLGAYRDDAYEVHLARARMELAHAETARERAVSTLAALYRRRERLHIYAPIGGVVRDLPRAAGATVRQGDPLAVVEAPQALEITAYLTQDESLRVGIGDPATIYIPALDRRFGVVVATVDRTDGYVDELSRQYRWRGDDDRSAKVVLRFDPSEHREATRQLPPGAPVIVLFERRNDSATSDAVSQAAGAAWDAVEQSTEATIETIGRLLETGVNAATDDAEPVQ